MFESDFSFFFSFAVSLGSQRSVAGRTCEEISIKEDSAVDGFYWLNSNGSEDPYVTFCNMKNGGGVNIHGHSINIDRFCSF